MKKVVLLFAALLVAGCGEKRSPEGSDSTGESAEPSADAAKPSDNSATLPLSDADVKRLLKEAVERDSLEERDGLYYHNNEPYSGWVKGMYDSGQLEKLTQFKDGKRHGLLMGWHANGQKKGETTFKNGKPDALLTKWHSNGQKAVEGIFKDGEEVSVKYWNSKGEEVESLEESDD